ncbi:ATPase AAA, partial [Bifidobacterium pseudolongum subsp. globosum]
MTETTMARPARRRATTQATADRILEMNRQLSLTRSVLAATLETATASQLEFMQRWFEAELASREQSRRLRLRKQAAFPADKTLDGYDWSNLAMPAHSVYVEAQFERIDTAPDTPGTGDEGPDSPADPDRNDPAGAQPGSTTTN